MTAQQQAEEARREAHLAISRLDTFAAKGHSREQIDGVHAAIDRALLLARLAALEEAQPFGGTGITDLIDKTRRQVEEVERG